MSCANRRGKFQSDLQVVKILAQTTANLVGVTQKIYRTFCDGITIYKFSDYWTGEVVETVNPEATDTVSLIGDNTSEDILPSVEIGTTGDAKPAEHKSRKKRPGRDLE